MRWSATYIIFYLSFTALIGQSEIIEGEISYLSSQNVYVKFRNTDQIEIGDTLYLKQGNGAVVTPAVVVTSKSSISCVGIRIENLDIVLKLSDQIIAKSHVQIIESPRQNPEDIELLPPDESGAEVKDIISDPKQDSISVDDPDIERKQRIRGRLSASMFSNTTTESDITTNRMRYTFTLQAQHINKSKLSLESNISFRHRTDEPMELSGHLNDYLKVYRLAADYEISDKSMISFGRKTNRKISNIGALDGFQIEHRFDQFSIGALVGSRPDYQDFGINLNLMQGGVYLSHESQINHKRAITTLAVVEQKNQWKTDRRYAYFQHSSTLFNNLNAFTSFEIDLFENINETPQSVLNLSSIYFSLRYRFSRKLSLFGSYDARKNVIYYESYKSYIDQLIDQETRQGFRLRVTYRPARFLTMGATAGMRSQNNLPKPSKNFRGNLTYSRVPVIQASATVSATLLQTAFLEGRIFALRLNKEIIKRKISGSLIYRNVHYQFVSTESVLNQNIAGINVSWYIQKRLSLSLNYEGTFEKNRRTDRVRLNLIKRFRS